MDGGRSVTKLSEKMRSETEMVVTCEENERVRCNNGKMQEGGPKNRKIKTEVWQCLRRDTETARQECREDAHERRMWKLKKIALTPNMERPKNYKIQ